MKEITAYQCDNCGEIYSRKTSIYKCKRCGKEVCSECGGFEENTCWECNDIICAEEESK